MSDDDPAVLVDRLRWDRRRDPYRGRREYSQTVRDLAEACERLIASGRAGQAVPVLRKAVDPIPPGEGGRWWPRSALGRARSTTGCESLRPYLQARCDAGTSVPLMAEEFGVGD